MEQSQEINGTLALSEKSLEYLTETRKWTNFLSILGFIGIGLMILIGLVAGIASSASRGGFGILASFIYIVFGGLYLIPIYHLYKFSNEIKQAIDYRRNYSVESAFESLKSHYKFIGIFTIVIISLYILIFIGSLAFMF